MSQVSPARTMARLSPLPESLASLGWGSRIVHLLPYFCSFSFLVECIGPTVSVLSVVKELFRPISLFPSLSQSALH